MDKDNLLKPTILGKTINPEAIVESRLSAKIFSAEVLHFPNDPPAGTEVQESLTQEEYTVRKEQLLAASARHGLSLSPSQVETQAHVMAVFEALYRDIEAKFKLRVEFDLSWVSDFGGLNYNNSSAIPFVGFATSVDPEGRRMVFAPSPVGGNMVFMDTHTSGLEVTGYMPTDENDIAVPGVEVKPYDLNALDPWLEGLVYAYNSLWV